MPVTKLIGTLQHPTPAIAHPNFGRGYGNRIAMNDTLDIALVGSTNEGDGFGRVHIYNAITGAHIQSLSGGPEFGASVATAGNYIVIGNPSDDEAYIYDQNYNLLTTLSENSGQYGYCVTMNELELYVSAPYEDTANGLEAGAVYRYAPDGTFKSKIEPQTVDDVIGFTAATDTYHYGLVMDSHYQYNPVNKGYISVLLVGSHEVNSNSGVVHQYLYDEETDVLSILGTYVAPATSIGNFGYDVGIHVHGDSHYFFESFSASSVDLTNSVANKIFRFTSSASAPEVEFVSPDTNSGFGRSFGVDEYFTYVGSPFKESNAGGVGVLYFERMTESSHYDGEPEVYAHQNKTTSDGLGETVRASKKYVAYSENNYVTLQQNILFNRIVLDYGECPPNALVRVYNARTGVLKHQGITDATGIYEYYDHQYEFFRTGLYRTSSGSNLPIDIDEYHFSIDIGGKDVNFYRYVSPTEDMGWDSEYDIDLHVDGLYDRFFTATKNGFSVVRGDIDLINEHNGGAVGGIDGIGPVFGPESYTFGTSEEELNVPVRETDFRPTFGSYGADDFGAIPQITVDMKIKIDSLDHDAIICSDSHVPFIGDASRITVMALKTGHIMAWYGTWLFDKTDCETWMDIEANNRDWRDVGGDYSAKVPFPFGKEFRLTVCVVPDDSKDKGIKIYFDGQLVNFTRAIYAIDVDSSTGAEIDGQATMNYWWSLFSWEDQSYHPEYLCIGNERTDMSGSAAMDVWNTDSGYMFHIIKDTAYADDYYEFGGQFGINHDASLICYIKSKNVTVSGLSELIIAEAQPMHNVHAQPYPPFSFDGAMAYKDIQNIVIPAEWAFQEYYTYLEMSEDGNTIIMFNAYNNTNTTDYLSDVWVYQRIGGTWSLHHTISDYHALSTGAWWQYSIIPSMSADGLKLVFPYTPDGYSIYVDGQIRVYSRPTINDNFTIEHVYDLAPIASPDSNLESMYATFTTISNDGVVPYLMEDTRGANFFTLFIFKNGSLYQSIDMNSEFPTWDWTGSINGGDPQALYRYKTYCISSDGKHITLLGGFRNNYQCRNIIHFYDADDGNKFQVKQVINSNYIEYGYMPDTNGTGGTTIDGLPFYGIKMSHNGKYIMTNGWVENEYDDWSGGNPTEHEIWELNETDNNYYPHSVVQGWQWDRIDYGLWTGLDTKDFCNQIGLKGVHKTTSIKYSNYHARKISNTGVWGYCGRSGDMYNQYNSNTQYGIIINPPGKRLHLHNATIRDFTVYDKPLNDEEVFRLQPNFEVPVKVTDDGVPIECKVAIFDQVTGVFERFGTYSGSGLYEPLLANNGKLKQVIAFDPTDNTIHPIAMNNMVPTAYNLYHKVGYNFSLRSYPIDADRIFKLYVLELPVASNFNLSPQQAQARLVYYTTPVQTATLTATTYPWSAVADPWVNLDVLNGQLNAWTLHDHTGAIPVGSTGRLVFFYISGGSYTGDVQIDMITAGSNVYSFESSNDGWTTTTNARLFSGGTGYNKTEEEIRAHIDTYYATETFSSISTSTSGGRWNRDIGGTPSSGTGRTDTPPGGGSYKLYCETSGVYYKVFICRTPWITLDTSALSYYEARYGATINTLGVYWEYQV